MTHELATPADHAAHGPHRRGRITTTVEQREGQPVLVKRAGDPEGRAALTDEAHMLTLARHPGVVELLALTETTEEGVELVLRFVSSRTLTAAACSSPEHAAGIVAAVAETVADLHALGLVHGRIEAAHIVLDPAGHPILVGFREATAIGPTLGEEPPVDRESGGATDDEPAQRHDDVAALGRLLRDLVVEQPDSPLIPERRWRRARGDAQDRRALLTLADHATADDARARPGARRFAAAILHAVPHATLGAPAADEPRSGRHPDTTDGNVREVHPGAGGLPDLPGTVRASKPSPASRIDGDQHRRPVRRGVPYALGLVGLTALVFGGASLQHPERPTLHTDAAPAPPAPASAAPASAASAPAGPAAGTVAQRDPERPSAAPPETTAPATTMPPLRFEPAGILTHDGHRYTIGEPGDELVIGPLTCRPDERDRVAVLRVATGEIFVFDGWAERDHARDAPLTARVEPGSHWLEPGAQTCAPLAIVRPDRTTQIIDVPPEGPR